MHAESIELVVSAVPSERMRDVVALIRTITGRGMADIIHCIRSGEPVSTEILYGNDHDEVAERLRSLTQGLPDLGASILVFEVGPAENPEAPRTRHEIGTDILRNILDSSDEQRKRQQDMWDSHGHV